MIKALIIDDNKFNRSVLSVYLQEYCPEIEIIGESKSFEEAEKDIKVLRPQLLFLDIDLGNKTAFDLIKKFPSEQFKIIFVTAHDYYAVKGFKANAVDFILKPVDVDELISAVGKVKKQIMQSDYIELLKKSEHVNVKNTDFKIAVSTLNGILPISAQQIIRLEADGKYTKLILTDNINVTSSKNLKLFEEILPENLFFRCHHSHIMNLKHMKIVDKSLEFVKMTNNEQIPVAQRKKNDFLQILNLI
jgi:two-component system, LytTR family, response regulator